MTSKEWRDYFEEFPDDPFLAPESNKWDQLIADYTACETERDDLREERECLRDKDRDRDISYSILSEQRDKAMEAYEDAAQDLHETQKERDDLRRKLEAYTRALESLTPGGSEFIGDPEYCAAVVCGLRDGEHRALVSAMRKLADASIANAALREASQELWDAVAHDVTDESRWVGTAMAKMQAALTLPAGGLAEEVRKYMRHLPGCNLVCATSEYDNGTCTCGLDALLAKLGGKL